MILMNLAACFLRMNNIKIRIVQERNQIQVQKGKGKHFELASTLRTRSAACTLPRLTDT